VTLAAAVFFFALSRFVDLSPSLSLGRPSVVWIVIAVLSPLVVLRRVLSQSVVTFETLFGALAVYLLMAIAFNYLFLEMQRFGPGDFFGAQESTSSFMYFSLVTITTVGYGDLTAVSDLGRFLATSEAIIGQVFLVTIVARLVSLYSRPPTGPDGVTNGPN
jgi:Ion channel